MLINSSGSSMVWPFLTIFLRERLGIPLTQVTLLLTASSAAGLAALTFAGPAVDRFGRKAAMVLSLLVGAGTMLVMAEAESVLLWVILMVVRGAFMPLLRVGANAMVADLLAPQDRIDGYALLRMSANVGIAIGPAIGGFIASASYGLAFKIAAGAHTLYAILLLALAKETAPRTTGALTESGASGYGPVLRDRRFMTFSLIYTLAAMAAPLMMILLPVYAKENFGVPENRYGFIMATNAAMVVLLQYSITRVSQRFPPLPVLSLGALFYALGVGSVSLGDGFLPFLMSMVVLTFGELLLVPTGTALTANLAPPDMRGRYMSIYTLTWRIGVGVAPLIGGLLNDLVAPISIWYGGLLMGLVGSLGFTLLHRRSPALTQNRRSG